MRRLRLMVWLLLLSPCTVLRGQVTGTRPGSLEFRGQINESVKSGELKEGAFLYKRPFACLPTVQQNPYCI